jgi:alpha-tubulin suppressor-like RCC1 family protein
MGANAVGQLGDGTTTSRYVPTQVGASTNWTTLGLGEDASCGIFADGTMHCMGANGNGQLGVGDTTNRATPARVATDSPYKSVQISNPHACGLQGTPAALPAAPALPPAPPLPMLPSCWGSNNYNQFGDNTATTATQFYAAPANSTIWEANSPGEGVISVSQSGACSILAGPSTLYCWGANANGQVRLTGGVGGRGVGGLGVAHASSVEPGSVGQLTLP